MAGVGRTTFFRWEKAGILQSELAKRGIALPDETMKTLDVEVTPPVTGVGHMDIPARPGAGVTSRKEGQISLEEEWKEKHMRNMKEAYDNFIKEQEAKFGKGVIFNAQSTTLKDTRFVSTGLRALDRILGGGLAEGVVSQFFGDFSTGKTTAALQAAIGFQKAWPDRKVLYVDTECAMDFSYAEALGLDMARIDFIQPYCFDEAADIIVNSCQGTTYSLVVVDSVAASRTRAVIESGMTDALMGDLSKMLARLLSKIIKETLDNRISVLFINQIRENFKLYGGNKRPGGKALDYRCIQMVEFRNAEGMSKEKEAERKKTKMVCMKNKVSPPLRECVIGLEYGKGFIDSDESADSVKGYIGKIDKMTGEIMD